MYQGNIKTNQKWFIISKLVITRNILFSLMLYYDLLHKFLHLATISFDIFSICYSQAKALIRYYQYCTCHDKNREEALHVL